MEVGFTQINNSLFRDKKLSVDEKYFLIILKQFDYKKVGFVFPSYETLMDLFNTTNRSKISKIIKSLVEKCYIVVKNHKRRNIYYILDSKAENSNKDLEVDVNKKMISCTNLKNNNLKALTKSTSVIQHPTRLEAGTENSKGLHDDINNSFGNETIDVSISYNSSKGRTSNSPENGTSESLDSANSSENITITSCRNGTNTSFRIETDAGLVGWNSSKGETINSSDSRTGNSLRYSNSS